MGSNPIYSAILGVLAKWFKAKDFRSFNKTGNSICKRSALLGYGWGEQVEGSPVGVRIPEGGRLDEN
jgi:hypothetical protein